MCNVAEIVFQWRTSMYTTSLLPNSIEIRSVCVSFLFRFFFPARVHSLVVAGSFLTFISGVTNTPDGKMQPVEMSTLCRILQDSRVHVICAWLWLPFRFYWFLIRAKCKYLHDIRFWIYQVCTAYDSRWQSNQKQSECEWANWFVCVCVCVEISAQVAIVLLVITFVIKPYNICWSARNFEHKLTLPWTKRGCSLFMPKLRENSRPEFESKKRIKKKLLENQTLRNYLSLHSKTAAGITSRN